MSKLTPMMKQYLEIKAQFPDALLFYRMGDFYELFMDDALTASKILEITLTSRDKNAENPVPMCGVPYHAADSYIPKLIGAGYKVAICDQTEDPKKAKGLVRREVTRVITPGLIVESANLEAKEPNYLAAVSDNAGGFALSFLDVSTGEFKVTQMETVEDLLQELTRIAPKELLVPARDKGPWLQQARRRIPFSVTTLDDEAFDFRRAQERLCRHFQVHSLEGFGLDHDMIPAIEAAGAILDYVHSNRLGDCRHVTRLLPYRQADFMILDEATVLNLELFQSASFRDRKGSLLDIIDHTRTAMGGRRLQHWLRYPLLDLERINARQEAVAELVHQSAMSTALGEHLEPMADLQRLTARISVGSAHPREVVALRKSLELLPALQRHLQGLEAQRFRSLLETWDNLEDIHDRIHQTLVDDPPQNLNAGGVIRSGVNDQLDHYTQLSTDAKSWMTRYEAEQRESTGIATLKVRYNKVFGYFIEVSRANLEAVPDHYVRKQTLVNAERYITEELKLFETQVLEADEKRLELENQIFQELIRWLAERGQRLLHMAETVAVVDCLAALAQLAAHYDYCRPELAHDGVIDIKEGRHPVIEHYLDEDTFVPNDLYLDQQTQQIMIITGPNMAGKSTMLRQAALLVLLAHIGSFVPARQAHIALVDRIFTRVGAADDLHRGRSTFMVEMQETANILHAATAESFIILDEIGRGTSTYDGMSIAWAVVEYLHEVEGKGVKALFATHYHELTELADKLPRVKNFNVAVKEWEQDILFFHKLVAGGSNRSYGIQVARLAGVPQQVIERAQEVLERLEATEHSPPQEPKAKKGRRGRKPGRKQTGFQLSMLRPSSEWLRERLLALDLDQMTPFAALQTLYALQEQLAKDS